MSSSHEKNYSALFIVQIDDNDENDDDAQLSHKMEQMVLKLFEIFFYISVIFR